MQCPSCNAAVAIAAGDRVHFSEACPSCSADLHVCLACVFHDRAAYNECREPSAERVSEPKRANRCEYFRPGEGGVGGAGQARAGALDALDALFKKS